MGPEGSQEDREGATLAARRDLNGKIRIDYRTQTCESVKPPRRLAILSREQLLRLTEARLLSYRKKALSLENSPEESDYSDLEIKSLDKTYIWFKSDFRWKRVYNDILHALARVQSDN